MPRFIKFSAFLLAASIFCFGSASAFQDEGKKDADKKDADYDANRPKEVDPLKNENPVATRIAVEARRLSQLAPEAMQKDISKLISTLFDAKKGDEERLVAADGLKEIIEKLDGDNAAQRSLSRQLSRRVDLAEAGIRALLEGPAGGDARELTNELIVRAAVDFENSGRDAHADVVRSTYTRLSQNHPAIFAKIKPVMLEHFFNYNLHLVISEPMLSRLLSDFRTENGSIAECILGAWVTGCQVTETMVTADIKPGTSNAVFDIVVDGRTVSDTIGRLSPATVRSKGNLGFRMKKTAIFDGKQFSAGQADIEINATNRTVGVSTDYDRLPIIGGIAQSIAADEAAKKRPAAEAIAARKLANRALPEFEKEISDKLTEANDNLANNVLANLRENGLEPEIHSARSSETHLALSTRTMAEAELAATPATKLTAPKRGIAIQIHETTMNAAIDSLKLEGTMSPQEVIDRIEDSLAKFLDRDVEIRDPAEAANDLTDFVWADSDPLRVRFDEGQIYIIFRTGFLQNDKGRNVPGHLLEIPLGIQLGDAEIKLIAPKTDARSILQLRPQALSGESSVRSVAQARTVAKELIQKTFKEAETTVSSEVKLKMPDESEVKLQITKLEVSDGWLTVVFE